LQVSKVKEQQESTKLKQVNLLSYIQDPLPQE